MEPKFNAYVDNIVNALSLPHCSFFEKALKAWPVGNSYVFSMQWFPLDEAIKKSFPNNSFDEIKIGQNLVQINGPMPDYEQPAEKHLHTHISGIVAAVTEGIGSCIYTKEGRVFRQDVRVGDVAIIPPNAPHTFEGNPSLEYMVIEFGPKLDYQKHHYK